MKVALLAALKFESSVKDSNGVFALHPGHHLIFRASVNEGLAVICQIIRPEARIELSLLVHITARKLVQAISTEAPAASYSPQHLEVTTAGELERQAVSVLDISVVSSRVILHNSCINAQCEKVYIILCRCMH